MKRNVPALVAIGLLLFLGELPACEAEERALPPVVEARRSLRRG